MADLPARDAALLLDMLIAARESTASSEESTKLVGAQVFDSSELTVETDIID